MRKSIKEMLKKHLTPDEMYELEKLEIIRTYNVRNIVFNVGYLSKKIAFYSNVFLSENKPIPYIDMVGYTTGESTWLTFLSRYNKEKLHYICPRVLIKNKHDSYVGVPKAGPHSSIKKMLKDGYTDRLWLAVYIRYLDRCIYIPMTDWHSKLGTHMYIGQKEILKYSFENTLLKLWKGESRKRRMIYNDVNI